MPRAGIDSGAWPRPRKGNCEPGSLPPKLCGSRTQSPFLRLQQHDMFPGKQKAVNAFEMNVLEWIWADCHVQASWRQHQTGQVCSEEAGFELAARFGLPSCVRTSEECIFLAWNWSLTLNFTPSDYLVCFDRQAVWKEGPDCVSGAKNGRN